MAMSKSSFSIDFLPSENDGETTLSVSPMCWGENLPYVEFNANFYESVLKVITEHKRGDITFEVAMLRLVALKV